MPALDINFLAILPESFILILAMLVLILDPFWKENNRRMNLGWLTTGGLIITIVFTLLIGQPGQPVTVFGGMLRFDWLSFFLKIAIIFGAAITAMLMMDHKDLAVRSESYVLLLASTIGMSLMVSAADLLMVYLAVETTSIPMYVLAGFLLNDNKSTEAGFKYLLFGAMTSAVMLYGLSLIFGFAGSTNFSVIAWQFTGQTPFTLGLILLIIVGLGFKVSLVPFHFWAPDTYEGAPTPIAGFLSTASKAAGFVVLARLLIEIFPLAANLSNQWQWILAIVAVLSMTLGNLVSLAQTNIKRLLAYSSIAHAGYALIGIIAANELGIASMVFYLIAYILTNLAAFAIVSMVGQVIGTDDIRGYDGLSRRSPYLALAMLAAFLSLAGMPPFGGFVAKVFVFAAGVQTNWTWLVVIGIINSVVGVYYYLNVMKYVYLYRMADENEAEHPIKMSKSFIIALSVLTLGVILIGTVFAPWFNFSTDAAKALF